MSKADKIPPTPPSVVAQITQLPDLPIDALRAIWRKLFQTDAPTNHRRFLERRIAYKLQEIAFRKENRNLLQNNQKRIQTLIRNGKPLKRNQDYCPIPGTVLIREYKGVEHRVTVTHDGQFERCPPWRAKRRRVVPGSREATRDTRRAEGAKGDPKGASERGVQSYGRPVCSRNELAMLWRNAG